MLDHTPRVPHSIIETIMILNRTWQLSSASLVLLCSAAYASGTSAVPPNKALRVEVTPEGAFYRMTESPNAAPRDGYTSLQNSGLIWTKTDGGLAWIATAVSIGNFGSEVFSEYDLNNQRDELFSSFDTNPPTAIFTNTAAQGSSDRHVASANGTCVCRSTSSIRTCRAQPRC
jgi:hypothetical protein